MQAVNDPLFSAWTLFVRSLMHLDHGAFHPAAEILEQSIASWEIVGHRSGLAWALCLRAEIDRAEGHLDAAAARVQEASALFQALDCVWGLSLVDYSRGQIARSRGERAEAEAWYRSSLALRARRGLWLGIAECLEALALTRFERGQALPAARLLAAAAAERERLGAPLPPRLRTPFEQRQTALRAALGPEAFAAAWADGQALPLEEAVALASG